MEEEDIMRFIGKKIYECMIVREIILFLVDVTEVLVGVL
jgi:hypothetical protein